jgi:hypothetical protein
MGVLGIPDPLIWLAYILCFASAGLCVVWGIVYWNSEDENGDDIEEEIEELEEKPLDEAFEEEKEE